MNLCVGGWVVLCVDDGDFWWYDGVCCVVVEGGW